MAGDTHNESSGDTHSESSEDVILLPWISRAADEDDIINMPPIDQVILLPWYPSRTKHDQEYSLDNEEVEISGSDDVILLPWYSSPPNRCQDFGSENEEPITPASPPPDRISQFTRMGFPEEIVKETIAENEDTDLENVIETLLTRSAVNKSPSPSECDPFLDDLSDSDGWLDKEKDGDYVLDKDKKLSLLLDMGFTIEEASSAIDASDPDTSLMELTDFIYAIQAAKIDADPLEELSQMVSDDDEAQSSTISCAQTSTSNFQSYSSPVKKRKTLFEANERWRRRVASCPRPAAVRRGKQKRVLEDDLTSHIPRNMVGFGVPNDPRPSFQRTLPEDAIGPPYFYYENVANTPKGVWSTISRFLYEIEPEYVDSLHFCAAARKRAYVHNLPVQGRFPLLPIPPQTIHEALPNTKKWWPSWDMRTKLNCLHTRFACATVTQDIRDSLEKWDGEPPLETQKRILCVCKKWNLVWTGKNKAAPLEPDEIEMILGYPKDHTRGGGTTRTDRYNSLGNSFQIDTVAYHFSVLKPMFPHGINVLSLFSGIGGAEVALHRLGIPLRNVVSVEISEINRNILRSWWEETGQKGELIEYEDVQQLTPETMESLMDSLGGFDLVVGGSPCNNLAGNNRVTRTGLQGEQSILFYDYFRILNIVKIKMGKRK